jgi:hypothetical protein
VLGGGHVFVLGGGHVFVVGGGHVFVLGGIDFASFYDISIGFWNCSESVLIFCRKSLTNFFIYYCIKYTLP